MTGASPSVALRATAPRLMPTLRPKINFFILLEAGAAVMLIVAVVWFALRTPRPEAIEG